MKKKKGIILVALMLVLILALGGCGGGKDAVSIGSKDFSENILLAEMFAQLIENHTDLKVNRKLNMGGTFVCFEAIKKGEIDIYPEYTGTGLTAQLKMDVNPDADEAYQIVSDEFHKQFDIKWLKPIGLNNTYAIGITKETAEKYNLTKCSQLASVSENLVFGADHEFFDRQDGYEGFIEKYGVKFMGEPKKMNISLKNQAVGNGDIDVTDVFATDGEIKKYGLVILEDDQGFFPPYYASPIIRNSTLSAYPQLEEVLNKLAGKIDNETMAELNYRVNIDQSDIASIAREFLTETGLLD
ncbi:MAG: glycine betaine ABC transporter substrate-binding protein [Anaerovoracaceae bacterium]|jgi:osmoprotectant transport system substrate-binding protein